MRCWSHDPSGLRHHLLVSTVVSPVGAITLVWGPDARGEKAPVSGGLRGVTVDPMSRS